MNAALGNSMNKLSAVAKKVTQGETFMKLDKIYTTRQVRTTFRNLDELAENFKLNGIIEPLVVHQEPDGRHRLIIGERRLRAAPLAGLDQVPVVIKRGLNEQQIRALQVAENEVRDDLTAYEKAMGVIEDVDNFGVKEAMKIWNVSSEGWISKRVAVKRYLPITLSILSDELSGDLEILLTINKIEQLDDSIAAEYRKQLERDEPLHRDAVRSRLNMMELQRKEAEQRQQQSKDAHVAPADEGADDTDTGTTGKTPGSLIEEGRSTALAKTNVEQGKNATTKLNAKPKTTAHPDAETAAAREKTVKGERLYALRKELFDYGRDNESYFKNMQELMFELKHSPEDGEWILWTGFLDMALPMLERLGADRSRAYLKRLQLELKGKTPAAMWADLHPSCAIDDPSKDGTAVPEKPKGWKF